MNSTPVYLQEEYAKTEIAKILNLLDEELVGLAPVKSRIREIAALLLIDKLRKNLELHQQIQVYICHLLVVQEQGKQQLD
jgi:hypothetical protein